MTLYHQAFVAYSQATMSANTYARKFKVSKKLQINFMSVYGSYLFQSLRILRNHSVGFRPNHVPVPNADQSQKQNHRED